MLQSLLRIRVAHTSSVLWLRMLTMRIDAVETLESKHAVQIQLWTHHSCLK